MNEQLFKYCLRIGDNSLVLGHRLSEWCGHGPVLEEDIAMTNIALDLVGQARTLLAYAGEIEGKGRSEDDLAYLRTERDLLNVQLAEMPNGDFAHTMARHFFFDAFNQPFYSELAKSKNEHLAAFAAKSLKEVNYHLRHSSEWVMRLGDGTEESHAKMQAAINDLWRYTGELFEMDKTDQAMLETGIGVDMAPIHEAWNEKVSAVLSEATLDKPEDGWMASGGRNGLHTEHMGFLLAELQYMQRAFPGATW